MSTPTTATALQAKDAMLLLPAATAALDTPAFAATLARELAPLLGTHSLVSRAAEQGGRSDPQSVVVTLLTGPTGSDDVQLGLAVFCDEIIGGCSCGDPPHSSRVYLELTLRLDPVTAEARLCPRAD